MGFPGIAAACLALMISACAHVPQRTLYEELGGPEGVAQIVELLLTRISDDPRIADHFASVDILNLNDKLVEQICFESGGPCVYTGRDMVEAHAARKVSHADFNAMVEDLVWAMDQRRIPRPAQNRLLKRLAPMHADIVR
ncbi:MAG: group 1 truncated hemoglobin [Lysobacteraceae bacterium]|nr:MAG: group 1 truncated hemoglobin [Xanthomonadaceae bacterium]